MGSIHSVLKKKKGRLNTSAAPSLISYTIDSTRDIPASRRSVDTKTYIKVTQPPVVTQRNRSSSVGGGQDIRANKHDVRLSRSRSEKCSKKKQLHENRNMAEYVPDPLNKRFNKQSKHINLGTTGESSTDSDNQVSHQKAMPEEDPNIYVNDILSSKLKEMAGSRPEATSNGVQPRINYTEVCFEKSPGGTRKQRRNVSDKPAPSVQYVDVRPHPRGKALMTTEPVEGHQYQNVVLSTSRETDDQSKDKEVVFRIQGFQDGRSKSSMQDSKGNDYSMSSKSNVHAKAQVELPSGTRVISVCAYDPPNSSVLAFRHSERATLLSVSDEGWWYVSMATGDDDGKRGWVPGNYWKEDKSVSEKPPAVERSETPPKLEPRQAVVPNSGQGQSGDDNEPWFMGRMSRGDSEALLSNIGEDDDCFLVRESTNRDGDCTLSVRDATHVRHFPIQHTPDNKYFIGKHRFRHLRTIVDYYSRHALFYSQLQQRNVFLGRPVNRSAKT